MIGYYYSAGSQAADEWWRMSDAADDQVTQAQLWSSACTNAMLFLFSGE